MIGSDPASDRARRIRHTSRPLEDRQVQVEDEEIGRPLGDGFEGRLAGTDDIGVSIAVAFEGVFDEPGDILLVFDDEYAVAWH